MEIYHQMSPILSEVVLRQKYKPSNKNWETVAKELAEIVERFFPESPYLLMHFSQLMEHCGNDMMGAREYIKKCNKLNLSIDLKFAHFQSIKRQQEAVSGTDGALNFLAVAFHRQQAIALVQESVQNSIRFWKLISRQKSSTDEIFEVASKIFNTSDIAKKHLFRLIVLSKSSWRSVHLYELYAKHVLNDKSLSVLLSGLKERIKHNQDKFNSDSAEDAVHCTFVGDEQDFGTIKDLTENSSTVLGMSVKEFWEFFPDTEQQRIKKLVQNETKDKTNDDLTDFWVWYDDQYVKRVRIFLNSTLDMDGNLVLTASLFEMKCDHPVIAVNSSDGSMIFFSNEAREAFGIPQLSELDASQVKLVNMIPALEPLGPLNGNSGQTHISVDGDDYKVWIEKDVSIERSNVVFVHLSSMRMDDDDDDDTNSYGLEALKSREGKTPNAYAIEGAASVRSSVTSSNNTLTDASIAKAVAIRVQMGIDRFRLFRKVMLFSMIVFILLSFVSVLMEALWLSNFKQVMNEVTLVGQWLHTSALINMALLISANSTSDDEWMKQNIGEMSTQLSRIYNEIETSSVFASVQTNFVSSKNVMETTDGVTYISTSLHLATLNLATHSRRMTQASGPELEVSALYITNTVSFQYMEETLKLCRAFFDNGLTYLAKIVSLNRSGLVFVVIALGIVMSLQIFPFLLSVQKTKYSMASTFSSIPKSVLRRLLRRSQADLAELQIQLTGAPRSELMARVDDFADDASQTLHRADSVRTITKSIRRNSKITPLDQAIPKEDLPNGRFSILSTFSPIQILGFVFKLVKLCVPLMAVWACFIITSILLDEYLADIQLYSGHYLYSIFQWNDLDRAEIALLAQNFNDTKYRWNNEPELYSQSDKVISLLAELSILADDLNYGNADKSIGSMSSQAAFPKIHEIEFNNACLSVRCQTLLESNYTSIVVEDLSNGLQYAINALENRIAIQNTDPIAYYATFATPAEFKAQEVLSEAILSRIGLGDIVIAGLIKSLTMLLIGLCCGFLVILLVVFYIVIKIFKGILDEYRSALNILQLIPVDIFSQVPQLRDLISEETLQ